MNKKLLFVIIGIAVLLIAASVVLIIVFRNGSTKSNVNQGTPIAAMSIKQALSLRHTATCEASNESIKSTVENLPGLSEDSGIYTEEIYDVPAGTNVDVHISAYDSASNTFTGSLIYPSQYGSYNFMLQKQSDGWRYVAFIRCD